MQSPLFAQDEKPPSEPTPHAAPAATRVMFWHVRDIVLHASPRSLSQPAALAPPHATPTSAPAG